FSSGTARVPPKLNPIKSSTELLALMDNHDGIVELPSRIACYVATYPFSSADVQKHAWLLQFGQDDVWIDKARSRSAYTLAEPYFEEYPRRRVVGRGFDDDYVDYNSLSFVNLGAALVARPAEEEAKLKFLIVCQSRTKPPTYKMIVSHSRKA